MKHVAGCLSLLATLLFLSLAAAAAEPLHPVTFAVRQAVPSKLRIGEYAQVEIDARVAPGWHLYSLTPTPPPGPTPTSFSVGGQSYSIAAGPTEDKPFVERDPNFGKDVAFHESSAKFYLGLRAAYPHAFAGVIAPPRIAVHYQTCNDTVCLPPASAALSVPITPELVVGRSVYSHPPRLPGVAANALASPPASSSAEVAPILASPPASVWEFALAAFGGGLLALLTPCVFPLIPVTFGFFTKQVGPGNQRKLIGLAGAYAVGIILSFVALGLVAALLFGAAGANRVAANPWFNLFFGALFVAFAFSFFESFIVTLPPALSRFARPAAGTAGMGGVLLMGLAFVFAAFTCTAPFIGTVLVAGASASDAREWLRPLLGMGCFALALALPFFLLALFPSLLSRLPRSGGWMTRFKAALGFVELAYALTYFSKADLVWQARILTEPLIFALWAAIAIAGMLYLLGVLRVSAYPEEPSRLTPGRAVSAALFGLAGAYCLYALTGRPVTGLLLAYLPPSGYGPSLAAAPAGSSGGNVSGDAGWLASYSAALAQAKSSGKPVFVDFTGYTCTNCRYVEQNTFTKPPVSSQLADQVTRLRLYTDGGADGAANQALQQKLFGTVALPLYAVVSADGKALSQLSGSNASPEQFGAFIAKGLQLAQAAAASAPAAAAQLASASQPAALWATYTPAALTAAGASGKPAVVDFTASWCTNCHALERTVFTAPQVSSQLGQFATFSANFDLPANGPSERKYGIVALPAVLFFDKRGHEVPGTRVTGLVSAADFEARLRKAAGA